MRTVVQRVLSAEVRVDGAVVGAIGKGAVLLVGIEKGDGEAEADLTARKVANRPGFDGAESPERAEALYLRVAERLSGAGLTVRTGRFKALMHVDLVNDGPVTFVLDVRAGAARA